MHKGNMDTQKNPTNIGLQRWDKVTLGRLWWFVLLLARFVRKIELPQLQDRPNMYTNSVSHTLMAAKHSSITVLYVRSSQLQADLVAEKRNKFFSRN